MLFNLIAKCIHIFGCEITWAPLFGLVAFRVFFQNPSRTRTEKDLKILKSVDLLGLPAVFSVCNERPWTQKSGYVLRLPYLGSVLALLLVGYRGRYVLGSWGSLIFGFYGTSGNVRNESSYYAQVLNKGVLGEYLTTWIGLRLRGIFLVSNRG
ncbi:hypothetical protein K501DRAFT_300237 [Backusella circina FSU 941]|nr:hypothetical protein K501DRAFT_300237 [Backusella circina FSU 941]